MTWLDNVKENLMTHKLNIQQATDLTRNIHLGVDTCCHTLALSKNDTN